MKKNAVVKNVKSLSQRINCKENWAKSATVYTLLDEEEEEKIS